VLIIDDSEVDAEAMSELLQRAGFETYILPSPIGATRKARELKVRVVIIDQNLPGMDGSKLTALFRGNSQMRHMRVVLVSGNDAVVMKEIARVAHADAFVSKKRVSQDLASVVKRLL
jgi:CheY-like chemotaxis protein